MALFFGLRVVNFPEGSFTVTPSSPWEKIVASVPADLTIAPPSPKCLSMLHTVVPSGIFWTLMTFPCSIFDFNPNCKVIPTLVPSTAGTNEMEPSSNLILDNGASLPRSWIRSIISPSCCSDSGKRG